METKNNPDVLTARVSGRRKQIIILIVVLVLIAGVWGWYFISVRERPKITPPPVPAVQTQPTPPPIKIDETQIQNTVSDVLAGKTSAGSPLTIPKGTQLLSFKVEGNNVILNFSKEAASGGRKNFQKIFSEATRYLTPLIAKSNPDIKEINYIPLIDGQPAAEVLK